MKNIKSLCVSFIMLFSLNCAAAVTMSKTSFDELSEWDKDNHAQAFYAFQQSCAEILNRNAETFSSPLLDAAPTHKWQAVCKAANKIHKPDAETSRQFFETWFVPYHLANDSDYGGLLTGYYLPLVHARLHRDKSFNVPIYALPKDLVKVDLGLFRPEFAGKSIVGQLKENRLFPYPNRAAITQGEIKNHAKVIAWSDSPIDVFFAQVQGSAIVEFPDHQQKVIGYAGDNGCQYLAIGKVLVERGELSKENVSMQTISQWLLQHPKQANELLNQNNSYVFFQLLKDSNPLGTERVALTPERSLAVDNRYIPFGAPVWTVTNIPEHKSAFKHLLIAQDTGGAIKGVVRGDIYWGAGKKAEFIAGRMNQYGEMWIFLPR